MPLLHATCHCGAVALTIPRAPEAVTNCNCSVCRRYGTLWAYYDRSEVDVQAAPAQLEHYRRGEQTLAFVRCRSCGCVTHWWPEPGKRKTQRMGVNVRMFDPAQLGAFRIRFLDGADSEAFVGEWVPPATTPAAPPPR